MPRQRTAREHSEALYKALDHLGWLHSHVSLQEFQEQFLLSVIENDVPEGEIDPVAMFQEFNMTKAKIASEDTYSREQDRATAIPRRLRHAEILAKHPVDYWWRAQCPACSRNERYHSNGCPAATTPGSNSS